MLERLKGSVKGPVNRLAFNRVSFLRHRRQVLIVRETVYGSSVYRRPLNRFHSRIFLSLVEAQFSPLQTFHLREFPRSGSRSGNCFSMTSFRTIVSQFQLLFNPWRDPTWFVTRILYVSGMFPRLSLLCLLKTWPNISIYICTKINLSPGIPLMLYSIFVLTTTGGNSFKL